jgi:L-lactate dehydrogenase complex protein LldG
LRQVSVTDVKEVELDNARDSILDAIRSTKRSRTMAEESEMARQYRSVGQLSLDQRIVRFQERLVDYRANVQETTEQELGSALESVLTTRGVTSVILPSDAPPFWSSDISCQVRVDSPPLSIDELDRMDATISGCAIAIAETGTIVLDAGAHQGRRALSLIPDHLVIIVYEDQIVEVVPEAIARLDATTPQTWISGPSATSDIELERVEGVHGPRVLDVLVVRNNEL